MVSLITAWKKTHHMTDQKYKISDTVEHHITIKPPVSEGLPYTVKCICGFRDGTYVDHAIAEATAFRHMATYRGNPLRKEIG